MDTSRKDLLGELAADAALERGDFLVQATEQFRRFLEANRERIAEIGGLTLIDDDPDYLSIAPDLTFRSRTRYQDEQTGEWVSETEVIESPAEIVELYNPAEIYTAFAEASREAAGLGPDTEGDENLTDGSEPGETDAATTPDADVYAAAADEWAAGQTAPIEADGEEAAAHRLYDLALEYQERSQRNEARLLEQFEDAASRLSERLGDLIVVDDDDERLILQAGDGFRAEVVPEDAEGEWRTLATPDELVEYYDPTDMFGDLADALAEAFPAVAPELERDEVEADAEGELADDDEEDENDSADDSGNGTGGAPRA